MSHDSIRNKQLIEYPDGKILLLCEVSCSNVTGWDGKRCWDGIIVHPKDSIFYTKETLKHRQEEYVSTQLQMLRDFSKHEVENGWATEYTEPTLDSYDYNGTVFPGGSKIKNGKAFYGGRPKKAEDYFREWNSVKRVRFTVFDKDCKSIYEASYHLATDDIESGYKKAMEYGQVYTSTYTF